MLAADAAAMKFLLTDTDIVSKRSIYTFWRLNP